MRLSRLNPQWLKCVDDTHWKTDVAGIAEADGIVFLCPKCFAANDGVRGTHSVICWKPHVPQTIGPTPGRWGMVGTGFEDLSLVAGSSSVLLMGGCNWHGFIKNGEVTDA